MKEYQRLQELYAKSLDSVRAANLNRDQAFELYEKYVSFVKHFATNEGTLLDVGCGVGWSSYFLGQAGYQVTGIDLNAEVFELPTNSSLNFVEGNVLNLPFPNSTFDIVASHNTIEHVPEPDKALLEMLRVLKPGGLLIIVCPNLLSIGDFLRAVFKYVWMNRPLINIFLRSPSMPRHPWGNTLPEVLLLLPVKLALILLKYARNRAFFSMRVPDLTPPFHADNDACYLSNPIDFVKFLPTQGCRIVRNGYLGRASFTNMVASGTYIVASLTDKTMTISS